MGEGHVYVCHWRHTELGFEGWIDRWPKRRVTGGSFAEMQDLLYEVAGEAAGDGEPQFEFEPRHIEAVGWEHLFVDGWRRTFLQNGARLATVDGVFEGGFCDRCKWPIGNRTDARLTVEWGPWCRGVKFFSAVARSTTGIPVASERLLDLFTPEERAGFDMRPVDTTPATRTRFFEFVPRRFVPEVAGKLFQPGGWQCGLCGRRYVSNARVLGYGPHVVSRDAIPPGAGLFFMGDAGHFSLCLGADRWEALKGTLRAAGITSSDVAIIEPGDREDAPALRDYPF